MPLPILRVIGFVIGIFLLALAASLLVPIGCLLWFERWDEIADFFHAALITLAVGLALVLPARPKGVKLRARDLYFLTVTSWLSVGLFAALPFWFAGGLNLQFTDAFFESMSGITTTGATVLTKLDSVSPGILLWRSLLHWLGGIGFIGMAVAILPMLRIAACGCSRPNRPTVRINPCRARIEWRSTLSAFTA